jgi:hypothetical protein
MQNKFFTILLITICTIPFTANGQKDINSPYSRYNLGMLEPSGSFRSLGMGGIETALRDNSSVSISNPASYSSLDTTSFIFDFGVDYSMNYLTDGSSHFSSDDMNFDHLIMGFPLTKGFGVTLGVVPFSNSYYKIYQTVKVGDPSYNPSVGAYSSSHVGTGGLYNFFIGTGLKITKNFSLGVNMTVLTGELRRINQIDFSDYYYVFNDNNTEKIRMHGINFNYGLQYVASFKNNHYFNAGVSLNSSHSYNTEYSLLAFRFTGLNSTDTISYVADDITKALIPGTLRAGISYGKKNKFMVGLDYVATNWSQSKIPGSEGYAADTRTLLAGFEFIPDKYSNYSFLNRLEYRAGGHIENNYVAIGGEQVKEFGLTAGIGIPLRRSLSKTNFFFDYTKRYGSSSVNLHTEKYFTFGISLNLYDYWFLKRKYE